MQKSVFPRCEWMTNQITLLIFLHIGTTKQNFRSHSWSEIGSPQPLKSIRKPGYFTLRTRVPIACVPMQCPQPGKEQKFLSWRRFDSQENWRLVEPHTREQTDWRWPISCVHSVMMVFAAHHDGGPCSMPTPFHSTVPFPSTLLRRPLHPTPHQD
jgi:hypothetical protein